MSPRRKAGSTKIAVGSRVRTSNSKTGVVVEDFGDLAGEQVTIDPDRTVQARRWAVGLDDGSLAFLDDDSLTVVD
ncbi:hypothetical protein MFM001_27260 [Mycobacterium sp. MFM001]|uniref:hypothetical protein n=1 Tax=Mycobacterium sp. MFM001 TaxID=2049453 RepID=UPI000DA580B7|nr:hypothetical protein [Mycobacterium sp. MFM001]GBE66264.1 hypothetical protein MFM001_27260 [Mycobacterium sp. MFM001]